MPKKRVSLTLEKDVVEKLDSEAGSRDVNRSRLVESIVEEHFRGRGIETAAILCGGEETRVLEEKDGEPFLAAILSHLADQDISRAILLVGNNRKMIEREFGSEHEGVALEYVSEEEPKGTAAALSRIEERIDGTFAVLNGHVLTDVDLQEMLETHREEGSTATIALTTVESPSEYGVARLKGRTVLGFVEKPEPGDEPSRLINAGTYIFEPSIFSRLDHDSIETVFEELAEESDLTGYIYGGKWEEAR